jgi:hypothetical protein
VIGGGNLASLNGTVGLNLANGHGITDLADNALPDAEPATDATYSLSNQDSGSGGSGGSVQAVVIRLMMVVPQAMMPMAWPTALSPMSCPCKSY